MTCPSPPILTGETPINGSHITIPSGMVYRASLVAESVDSRLDIIVTQCTKLLLQCTLADLFNSAEV